MRHIEHAQTLEPSPDADAVSRQLERVLVSDEFRNSKHMSGFLRFVVEEALVGRSSKLKGYSIALSVFNRPEDFDPAGDPIVRIYAGKVRRGLAYYYDTDGVDDPVHIHVPKGRYVPTFSLAPPRLTATARPGSLEVSRIVVLPLATVDGDQGSARFAQGLTEELLVALTRCSDMEVYATPTPAGSGWPDVDVRELARSRDARFVLGGTVRGDPARARVTARLVDGRSGAQLWADSYERAVTDENPLCVQEDIASRILDRVADRYEGAIQQTLLKELPLDTHGPTSCDAALWLNHYNRRVCPDTHSLARRGLERVVERDRECAIAWAGLGELHLAGYVLGYGEDEREATLSRAFAAVRRALASEPDIAYARFVSGVAYLVARDRRGVVRTAEELLDVCRQRSTKALGAWLLALGGHWERGSRILAELTQALTRLPGWIHSAPCLDAYRRGDYETAYEQALQFNMPTHLWDPVLRAAALGQLGRTGEAREAVREAMACRPDLVYGPTRYLECFIIEDELVQHVLAGLREGGL